MKTWEMTMTAPLVAAQRTTRMALAGWDPGPRDRRESNRMSEEKVDAFSESVVAAAMAMFKIGADLTALVTRTAWTGGAFPSAAMARTLTNGTSQVVATSLAPVHRRVMANGRRLRSPRTTSK